VLAKGVAEAVALVVCWVAGGLKSGPTRACGGEDALVCGTKQCAMLCL
jgi:hypothetical protein